MKLAAIFCAALLGSGLLMAQTPAPVVVQAATPAPTPVVASVPASQTAASPAAALQTLGAIKAANEEILRKQNETLVRLDELQKAAEQLKIYSKRG